MKTVTWSAADSTAAGAGTGAYLAYMLYAVAGLLAGGAWSAYKAENKILTIAAAALATIAFAAATVWLMGAMR